MTRIRLTAVAAALAVASGTAMMVFTLGTGPGRWWQGYVSEAGTAGQPYAVTYRWGLITLALGVALLSVARSAAPRRAGPPSGIRRRLAGTFWLRGSLGPLLDGTVTVWALAVAAVLAAVSGAVPCSDQCPLPPYEPTTIADVVHAGASVVGMVVLAAAMATMWFSAPERAVRWLAGAAVLPTVPLGAVLAVTMLVVGRGTLGAVVERLVLLIAVAWLVGVALLTARPVRESTPPPRPGR
ncbi:DUF998 domain-containing protein [Actinoplanes derwentensis]|uniref:DUF998 domain-containing protein n=1 Tax=Actinoplanes derwentensis TaxID=113562 RepID=A0A1H1XCR8_9ACTN|nr:DUF998 domain-containing protein [Actinoplanes derwentensis]GID87140.1 hypothetical protein Ade03nite_60640 [Actinoplanes derwentensis]SDT07077.1 Protein of unknown function [Actinoplanes derwentensis]